MIEPEGRTIIAQFHVALSDFCLSHSRMEPDRPGDYRYCLECCHVFRTEDELLDAENELRVMYLHPPVTGGDQVWSCPHCTHDF